MKQDDEKKRRQLRELAIASSAGVMIVGAVLIGYFLGRWLDTLLHTGGAMVAVGVVLGSVAAFWELYRMLTKAGKR